MSKRVMVGVADSVEKKLRKIQSELIIKENRNVDSTNILNEILWDNNLERRNK